MKRLSALIAGVMSGIALTATTISMPMPAKAALSTCWWQMTWGANRLKPAPCYVSSRYNSKGHLVFDVVEKNGGYERVIVLWEGKEAEVILLGKVYRGVWDIDSEQDIWVRVEGGSFAFRLPKDVSRTARPRPRASSGRAPTLYDTMSDTPFQWKR